MHQHRPPGTSPGGRFTCVTLRGPMTRPDSADRTPSMEPWALAAFLGATVLGWCPLAGLGAVVAGGVAIQRIARSDGRRRGTGLAIAGMAIATAILLAEGWLLGRLQDQVADSMDEQANASIGGLLGDGAPPTWDVAVACADADVHAFRTSLTEAIGALKSVSITRREATGVSAPVVTTAFNAVGERATAFGVARFSVQPATFPPVLATNIYRKTDAGWRMLAHHASPIMQNQPSTPGETGNTRH